MTGGQRVEGGLTVPQIARQVAAEGARKIVVVSDEPDKYAPDAGFPPGVDFRHRDQLDTVQRELRDIPGLTILIYDQTCAAEKRRRRKRGTFPDPQKRVFINEAVCEGCGDCSTQSNCVSVQPVETLLGRKRRIDQSACNKDFSCLKGFCPSFVTVHGGAPRKAKPPVQAKDFDPAEGLPAPQPLPIERPYGILVTGIGGTGVITIGALLGMAAHLEGKGCTVLDSTGLSQKNGAVMSHVRIAATPEEIHAARIVPGAARLVLACDMVVATGAEAFAAMEHGVTRAVVNSAVTPTAGFVSNNEIDFQEAAMQRRIRDAIGADHADFVAATTLATALLGDSIATNLFMLGYAFQKGLIPLSLDAIMQAIALNGVAVAKNQETFAWGRRAAADPAFVQDAARSVVRLAPAPIERSRRPGRAPRAVADCISGRGLCGTLPRCRAVGGGDGKRAPEGHDRPGRGGGSHAVSSDGVQGRIRGRPACMPTPAFRRSLEAQFEGEYRDRVQPRPAAVCQARSGHGTADQADLWAVAAAGFPPAGEVEAVARHDARSVRPYRGAPHGTPADRRVRSRWCARSLPGSRRTTTPWRSSWPARRNASAAMVTSSSKALPR